MRKSRSARRATRRKVWFGFVFVFCFRPDCLPLRRTRTRRTRFPGIAPPLASRKWIRLPGYQPCCQVPDCLPLRRFPPKTSLCSRRPARHETRGSRRAAGLKQAPRTARTTGRVRGVWTTCSRVLMRASSHNEGNTRSIRACSRRSSAAPRRSKVPRARVLFLFSYPKDPKGHSNRRGFASTPRQPSSPWRTSLCRQAATPGKLGASRGVTARTRLATRSRKARFVTGPLRRAEA
mmetsp:Transcript_8601/g.32212  ORF Transcript_8601/g.32212 Transcript_8601/m.32212 type:complete len:235 (+) Transcript_8601:671-1375(+)